MKIYRVQLLWVLENDVQIEHFYTKSEAAFSKARKMVPWNQVVRLDAAEGRGEYPVTIKTRSHQVVEISEIEVHDRIP